MPKQPTTPGPEPQDKPTPDKTVPTGGKTAATSASEDKTTPGGGR